MDARAGTGSEWREEKAFPLWLRAGFWACTVIAVAVVIRATGCSCASSPLRATATGSAGCGVCIACKALTLAHILPALAFVALAPQVVFRPSSETTWPGNICCTRWAE